MTNQASEERIRGKLLSAYLDGRFSVGEIGKLTDKQAEPVDRMIDRAIELIRTEKLKLLDEVVGIASNKQFKDYTKQDIASFFSRLGELERELEAEL